MRTGSAVMWIAFCCICLACGAWYLAAAHRYSERREQRKSAVHCDLNMYNIGKALSRYAEEHHDQLPDTLADLLPDGYIASPDVLFCPEDKVGMDSHIYSYAYFGKGKNLKKIDAMHLPILIENTNWHKDVTGSPFVVFADGHGEHVSPEEWERFSRLLQ